MDNGIRSILISNSPFDEAGVGVSGAPQTSSDTSARRRDSPTIYLSWLQRARETHLYSTGKLEYVYTYMLYRVNPNPGLLT